MPLEAMQSLNNSTQQFSFMNLQHMRCPRTTHHRNVTHCGLFYLRFWFKINDSLKYEPLLSFHPGENRVWHLYARKTKGEDNNWFFTIQTLHTVTSPPARGGEESPSCNGSKCPYFSWEISSTFVWEGAEINISVEPPGQTDSSHQEIKIPWVLQEILDMLEN